MEVCSSHSYPSPKPWTERIHNLVAGKAKDQALLEKKFLVITVAWWLKRTTTQLQETFQNMDWSLVTLKYDFVHPVSATQSKLNVATVVVFYTFQGPILHVHSRDKD